MDCRMIGLVFCPSGLCTLQLGPYGVVHVDDALFADHPVADTKESWPLSISLLTSFTCQWGP